MHYILRLMDEWAGSNLHIIFVAVEMEAAAGDGSGGLVRVRPFHGQRRRKIASELGAPPKYGTRQAGMQAGASPLLCLPTPAADAIGYYNAVHKILTAAFRDVWCPAMCIGSLYSRFPFPSLSLATSFSEDLFIVNRGSRRGTEIERRKLIVKASRVPLLSFSSLIYKLMCPCGVVA